MRQKNAKKRGFGEKRSPIAQKSPLPPAYRAARAGLSLYGQHAVLAALGNERRQLHQLFASDRQAEKLQALAKTHPCPIAPCHLKLLQHIEICDRDQLNALCASSHAAEPVHQGIAVHAEPLEEVFLSDILSQAALAPEQPMRLMILDQVTDPRNIGAIMRSAQAFGAAAIVMTRKHAPPETPALAKTAAGALETVPLIRETNLARALEAMKDAGFMLAGLDAKGTDRLEELSGETHLGLIMGAEAGGMRRLTIEACDRLTAIEMTADAESLNVSVAAAIALYATRPHITS